MSSSKNGKYKYIGSIKIQNPTLFNIYTYVNV